MRVLVTGASGFIGANLTRLLLSAGHDVHLVLRPGHDTWRVAELLPEVAVHPAALEDADAVDRVLAEARPEAVFHLATYGAYPHQTDRAAAVATNLDGLRNLAAAALRHGCEALVNAGTSSEYGRVDHPPAEDEPAKPVGPYAETKAEATSRLSRLAEASQARIVTLRVYSAYGEWEEPTRFIPALVLDGLDGRLPPLADPRTARDFVHVDDVARAFQLALGAPSGVYNVGTGVQTSLAEAVELSRRLFRIDAEPEWGSMEGRSWDTSVWVSDPRRAASVLGWSARIPFRDGLARTADWFRSRPDMVELYRARRQPASH